MDGRKDDQLKTRWDLIPWVEIEDVVKVLTHGAGKYEPHNWTRVPDAHNRYFAAAMRHITAWWSGDKHDDETGLPHLAHAVCCLLFLMWFDNKEIT